jgi:hypothetical protein
VPRDRPGARRLPYQRILSQAKKSVKRDQYEGKEIYRGKRDLLQRQKRPTIEAKETY